MSECGQTANMDVANLTANIRVDTATRNGSVIDVIRLINPDQTRQAASEAITALRTSCPELASRIGHLKIDGKGKHTPVADARTLVEIVWLLPGRAARDFRRSSAIAVCRILGGDLSLVQEIEARHHSLQGTQSGRAAQEFMLAESAAATVTVEPVHVLTQYAGSLPVELQLADTQQKSAYFEEWVCRTRAEARQRARAQDVVFYKDAYEALTSISAADDRTKIAFSDLIRRAVQQPSQDVTQRALVTLEPVPEDDLTVPTPNCHPAHRGEEISMHSVASKYRLRISAGKESLVGKRMKALYAQKYSEAAADNLPKRNVPFRGKVFAENCYWSRDEQLMRSAIEVVATS